MESSFITGGRKQSSQNILTYHRDENGLIQWDDPSEQTTDGFDEPDGDIGLGVVCSDRQTLPSERKQEISAVKTPSNFLLRTGSLFHITHSNPTGSNESDQRSLRQLQSRHTFPPNDSRQRSLLTDPDKKWCENGIPGDDVRILSRPQYSPLTPPATPKKSPRAVGFPDAKSQCPKSPLVAHAKVREDVSKFPFPDGAEVRSTSNVQLLPVAREITNVCANREADGVISPVQFGDVSAKSPVGLAFKFEEHANAAAIQRIIKKFKDDISREAEDITPIALQDPPKPKHKKKTVTWHHDTLDEFQQRGTTDTQRSECLSLPSHIPQTPCDADYDVIPFGSDCSEKDDDVNSNRNDRSDVFRLSERYHAIPGEFSSIMTSPSRKRQLDLCTSQECGTPTKQECIGNGHRVNEERDLRENTSSDSRTIPIGSLDRHNIQPPRIMSEDHVIDPFYEEAMRLRQQSRLELLRMLQSPYRGQQSEPVDDKNLESLGFRSHDEQSRYRDDRSYRETATDRRLPTTPCKSPRLSDNSPPAQFLVPNMSPSGRKPSMSHYASPRRQPVLTGTHFPFPPPSSPTSHPRSPSPFHSSAETFLTRRKDSTFQVPASQTTRDQPYYRCKSPRGQNSSSPRPREATTKTSPFSAQGYTASRFLQVPQGQGVQTSAQHTHNPDESIRSQSHPDFRHLGVLNETSAYPRSCVPPSENPWRFPPYGEASPTSLKYSSGPRENAHSATRRRLFTSDAAQSDSDDDSVLMNSIFDYLVKKDILSTEDSNRLRENATHRKRSKPEIVCPSPFQHAGRASLDRSVGTSDQRGVHELEAEYSYSEGLNMTEERSRVLRLRGHSMGEVEEHLSQHEFHERPSVHRSHSLPEEQETQRRIYYSESHHYSPQRRPQSRIGNIDIKVECEDVIEYNRQLAEDLTELRSPSGSSNCSCAEVEEHILQMTREAYANIRRHNDSPEAFSRFESEVQQTNDTITDALRILRTLKRLCGHGRRIEEIYSGSVIFTVNCPSSESLEELWYWYNTGELLKMFQSGFVTESLKSMFNAKGINLRVTIEEADLMACRHCLEVVSHNNINGREFYSEERRRIPDENVSDEPRLTTMRFRSCAVSSMSGSQPRGQFSGYEEEASMVENPVRQPKFHEHLVPSNNGLKSHMLRKDIYDALYRTDDGLSNGNTVVSPTRKAFQELKYNP